MIDFFEQERLDYALIGAFALKAYGYLRATQDVDLVARQEDQPKIIAFLESLGYETIYRSPGYSNHLHPISKLGRIDLVYVKGDTADAILSEARPLLLFEGLYLPVVRAEHLVALKVFAMKNVPERSFREMADLKYLLTLPGIDINEIKKYFDKYGLLEKFYESIGREKEKSEP